MAHLSEKQNAFIRCCFKQFFTEDFHISAVLNIQGHYIINITQYSRNNLFTYSTVKCTAHAELCQYFTQFIALTQKFTKKGKCCQDLLTLKPFQTSSLLPFVFHISMTNQYDFLPFVLCSHSVFFFNQYPGHSFCQVWCCTSQFPCPKMNIQSQYAVLLLKNHDPNLYLHQNLSWPNNDSSFLNR